TTDRLRCCIRLVLFPSDSHFFPLVFFFGYRLGLLLFVRHSTLRLFFFFVLKKRTRFEKSVLMIRFRQIFFFSLNAGKNVKSTSRVRQIPWYPTDADVEMALNEVGARYRLG